MTTAPTAAWVGGALGVRLDGGPGTDGLTVHDVLGLALRRNPKRAHLLVSRVLAKHVPTDPRLVRAAGLRLGQRVGAVLGAPDPCATGGPATATWRAALAGDAAGAEAVLAAASRPVPVPGAVVVGYAETATGLGSTVADALGAAGLHSTRRAVPGAGGYAGFEEEHSHATGHRLFPTHPDVLDRLADPDAPLVLVDDELSTGRTVANTLRALHARTPRRRYVVATLVDVRGPADHERLTALAAELGARVDVVALVAGTVALPAGVLDAGRALAARVPEVVPVRGAAPAVVEHAPSRWPGVPVTARAGTPPGHGDALAAALAPLAAELAAELAAGLARGPGEVLVLGSEELLHAPQLLALELARRVGARVLVSSTTRSPVLAVDDPGCAVRSSVAFRSHDPAEDGPGVRYAHNAARPGGRWSAVVLVVDSASRAGDLHAPDGALAALAPLADHLHLVVLPADDRSPA